jgi:deoxyribodipyrimidine photolyase-related protein
MFIILPHQLYDIKLLPIQMKDKLIVLWEHPHYFKSYKFNKKKLMLHRASMKYYYDLLKDNNFNVHYIEFHKSINREFGPNYTLFDPIDKLNGKYKLPNNYTILESPNFLLTKDDYNEYFSKTKTKIIFNNFYLWSKKKINLFPKLKSMDKMNRETFDNSKKIPSLLNESNKYIEYIKEAVNYVEKHFPNNYGNCDNFNYPISRESTLKWLKHFIKYKFKHFGKYQDFINKDNIYMFHSILSSSLNIGLINPSDVIKEISKYKSKIPINSFEGFLRQLFWREYQRFCYIHINYKNINYFGNKKKLSSKWYKGELNIEPVDDLIKSGFDTGYMHHIGRLMVIGNFMNLSGIAPKEGFRWFMEFSIDSYEWVMHQNVYDMVFFVTGGRTMTRPYISSSNYILKMSNYNKSKNEWSNIWDNLYHSFINRHRSKLYKFRYYFPNL